jgi:DNA-binding NarL/FixJ family response regulator
MLLDLKMPDGDGQSLLDELAIRRTLLPTIVMTAFGSGSRAIEAMRAGGRLRPEADRLRESLALFARGHRAPPLRPRSHRLRARRRA